MARYDYDALINEAGGKYGFVALVQRRMRELQDGAPVLIEETHTSLLETAIAEIESGKIWLARGEEARIMREEHEKLMAEMSEPEKKLPQSSADI